MTNTTTKSTDTTIDAPTLGSSEMPFESKIVAPTPNTSTQHYMMFMMLLEAAMRHREAYWRESVADYRAQLEYGNAQYKENYERHGKKVDKGWQRRVDAKTDHMVQEYTKRIEYFNREAYALIDKLTADYSEAAKKTFEEHATSFSVLCGEMNLATLTRDPAELLVIAKMYNAGQMDNVFKEYRALENKSKVDIHEAPKVEPIEIETKAGDVKLDGAKDDKSNEEAREIANDVMNDNGMNQKKDDLTQKIHPFPGKHDVVDVNKDGYVNPSEQSEAGPLQ